MDDVYITLKNLFPQRLRVLLKPLYLKWSLRYFREPQSVHIKKYDFLINIDSANGAVDQYIYMHRNWETRIGNVIEEALRPGDTFLDIGANIGYFSLLASKLVGPTGQVIAFEPLSRIAKQFRSSVELNDMPNISVRQMALGESPAEMKMSLMPGNIGGSSLVKNIPHGSFETVTVGTLDNELATVERVDLMKIDVEGYEYEALLGAKRILSVYKPKLVLELSPRVYAKRDASLTKSILQLLTDFGYVMHDIDNNLAITDIDSYLDILGTEQTNLFATVPVNGNK